MWLGKSPFPRLSGDSGVLEVSLIEEEPMKGEPPLRMQMVLIGKQDKTEKTEIHREEQRDNK